MTLTASNTYSGGTTLGGGTLAASNDYNLGAVTGPLTFAGGTLLTATNMVSARPVVLAAAGGMLDNNGFNVPLSAARSAGQGPLP